MCVHLIGAVGIKFKSRSHNAHVFIILQSADRFAIADLLTFGTVLKSAILTQDFRTWVLPCAGISRPLTAALGMGASPEAEIASGFCPWFITAKPAMPSKRKSVLRPLGLPQRTERLWL